MTLRHAGSVDFCVQSVSSNDCNFEAREWHASEPVAVRANNVIYEHRSQVSRYTIGPQSSLSHEALQTKIKILKDMLESRLSSAVQALETQHQQAMSMVDEFCRTGLMPTHTVAELGISVPGAMPFDVSVEKLDGQHPPRPPTGTRKRATTPSSHELSSPARKNSSHELVKSSRPTTSDRSPKSALRYEAPTVNGQSPSSRPVTASGISEAWAVTEVSAVDHAFLTTPRFSGHTRSLTSQPERHQRRVTIAAAEQAQLFAAQYPSHTTSIERYNSNKAVFPNAADMKDAIKKSIMKPEYNVADKYVEVGCWQSIARSGFFENLTLVVIALNSLWIAIDTDLNHATSIFEAELVFVVGENFFCVYFCGELIIRFMAFANKSDAMRDGWFVFDSFLVILMVFELWIMNVALILTANTGNDNGFGNASVLRLVRLLRLTRMARMARLLRVMPELMILIKGISAATRSVFFTLCLLAILIYVFGIAFTQLCDDTPLAQTYFPTVRHSMATLLLRGTLPDLADFVDDIGEEHFLLAVLMMFFILFSVLTVMNMLVGVLVEVVSVVSAVEKEQMTVQFVRAELLSMLQHCGVDQDGDKQISKKEFESLITNPDAARIIQEVGVDVVGLVDYGEHIFKGDEDLGFPEFMEAVLQLRGSNKATVKDMVDIRKFITNNLSDLAERIEDIASSVTEVQSTISNGNLEPVYLSTLSRDSQHVTRPLPEWHESCRNMSTVWDIEV